MIEFMTPCYVMKEFAKIIEKSKLKKRLRQIEDIIFYTKEEDEKNSIWNDNNGYANQFKCNNT